jgi:hypothetical protein
MCYSGLEDVAELEVRLPLRCLPAERISPIETVAQIYPEGSDRGHDGHSKASAPEQTGGIEVPGACPQVPGIIERVEFQLLADSQSDLGRCREKGVSE